MATLKRILYDTVVIVTNLPRYWLWKRGTRGEAYKMIDYDFGKLVVDPRDYRAYTIARNRGTQKSTVRKWVEIINKFKPDLIVDVGANYGEFAASVVNLNIAMVVIEPNPWIIDCLKKTFADKPHVTIVNAAIAEQEGEMPFFINPHYSGISSLSKDNTAQDWFFGKECKVQKVIAKTFRLDTLLEKLKFKSVIIKADVEGYEYAVFKSASKSLERCDWWHMLLEFHEPSVRKAGFDINAVWQDYRKHNPDLPQHPQAYSDFVISKNR